MLDGSVGVADFQCRQLLGERYFRLAPVFAPNVNIPLDAADRVGELVDFANRVDLGETLAWIAKTWA